MYSYIKGTIEEILPTSLVVENNGIGYLININTNNPNIMLGQEIKVYTYYHVTQENISLFGFYTQTQRQMFLKLLSVSKVGAKTALSIISNIDVSDLVVAILEDDSKTIAKVPGLGIKTAQRIILEIKDKLKDIDVQYDFGLFAKDAPAIVSGQKDKTLSKLQDAKDALLILGYSSNQITSVLNTVDLDQDVEQIIKEALQNMS